MDITLCFPSLYLAGDDLNGEDCGVTIRKVSVDELKRTDGATEKKPCLYFEEALAKAKADGDANQEKRMVLNKTNAMRLKAVHGKETDGWVGKRITLTTEKVDAFGQLWNALRVKES